jgi:hypothetical protein
MKRRNFLSGLMAAPLAVKARLARFFVPTRCVERCGAPILQGFVLNTYQLGSHQPSRNQSLTARQRRHCPTSG